MRRDHDLSDGEARYVSHAAVPAPHAAIPEQAENSHPHSKPTSRGISEWVSGRASIGLIVLGLLLTVAWFLGLAYLLVRFFLWLFS